MKLELKINPMKQEADRDEITLRKNELEVAPVAGPDGKLYQFDEDSRRRMYDAIEDFDFLPIVNNGVIIWLDADNNEVPLTKEQLSELYTTLRRNRAIRGSLLHKKALEMKSNPPKREVLEGWTV